MWNKLIKSNWFHLAVLLIVPLIILGFILKSFFSKKEPYQYVSICDTYTVSCGDSYKDHCVSQGTFDGLVKNKSKCEYLKIPQSFNPTAERNHIQIDLPLSVAVPKIKTLLTYEYPFDEVKLSRGSNASILSHMSGDKPPNTKLFGLDVNVNIRIEPWDELNKRSVLDWQNNSFYWAKITAATKDKTAHFYCLDSKLVPVPQKFDITQFNPRVTCHVTALADNSIYYSYKIPYEAIAQFEEINKRYSQILKSFKYEVKH